MNTSERDEEKAHKQRVKTGWSYWIAARPLALGGEAQVVHWWEWEKSKNGKRVRKHKRKQFSDEAALDVWLKTERTRRERETTLIRRNERGGGNVVSLVGMTPTERAAVAQALAAIRAAGGKVELVAQAAESFAATHLTGAKMTVSEIVSKHLESIALTKRPPTVTDRRFRLSTLVEEYGDTLAAVMTAPMIEDWVLSIPKPPSQSARRRAANALFTFAVRRGYVPSNPVAHVEKIGTTSPDAVDVFTPSEAEAVLRAAQLLEPRMVAFFAIGLFAGLRPQNEIKNLNWNNINLEDDGKIKVVRSTAKTRRTRYVPISENLRAWLKSLPKAERTGSVHYSRRAFRRVMDAAMLDKSGKPVPFTVEDGKPIFDKKAKNKPVLWTADVMRHSFCTYRMAIIRNIHQLCEEAGNTPHVARAHYLEPKAGAEAEAKLYWAIMPINKKGN